jgi:general secretion pathway protein B
MSYILDALRKADAQRERDPARGIHAQTLHGATGEPRPDGRYRPWLWIAVMAGVAAIASGAWLYGSKSGATPHERLELAERASGAVATAALVQPAMALAQPAPVGSTAGAASSVAAPASVPAPAINPPAAPPRPVTPPARDPRASSQPMMRGGFQPGSPAAGAAGAPANAAATQRPPASTPPVPGAGFPQAGASPAAPMTPRAPATNSMARPAPSAVAPPRTPAVSAPVAASVPTPPVAGLPADAPKLVLNGGVYSANRAQRMLIVNGQVAIEGTEVAPGVVLDEIRAKTAVLRFRGARYTVSY